MILSRNNFNILTSVIILPYVQCDDSSTYLIQETVNVRLLYVINKQSKEALNLILESTVFFIYSLQTYHIHWYIKYIYIHRNSKIKGKPFNLVGIT